MGAVQYESELLALAERGKGYGFFAESVSTPNHWRYLGSKEPQVVHRALFRGIENAGKGLGFHAGDLFMFLCSDTGRDFAVRLAKATEHRTGAANVKGHAYHMMLPYLKKLKIERRAKKKK